MTPIVEPDDIDYHSDLQWHREELARQHLTVSDVLAECDQLIASEPDEQGHPLYSLAAHALDGATQTGSAWSLMARFQRLIDLAIDRLVDRQLDGLTGGEVD